ncbi:MAG: glycosyltransferase family 2 protein [Chloroflexi bacterium]|nr:MAG: glycosyltransferase family 2 protein [Chloroflexota bacterium]
MGGPHVTIIVLNWNGGQETLDCLASLRRVEYPRFDVVVVDNGSKDGSPQAIRERFPEVTLIETGENLGFTGGNNVGIRHALERGSDYLLLLNHDTEVAPDFLTRLVEVAEAEPEVGMAGPLIYYHARPDRLWSAGGIVDRRRGEARMLGIGQRADGAFRQVRPVDFVSGCALLVKAPVVARIGLLDDRFFAYYEEVEWCWRARQAGYQIVVVPQARVWHKISPEARAASPTVHYYMTRNRLLFLRLAGLGWRAWFHTLVLEDLRTLVSWTVKPRWRHKGPQRRAMLQALWDFGRGRLGRR